nr:myosin-2-like isoform X1 [Ipomoea trifida]
MTASLQWKKEIAIHLAKKPIGLIALLDEESNFPKATDLTFTNKLKEHLKTNQCLKGERGGAFSIRHYAGEKSSPTTKLAVSDVRKQSVAKNFKLENTTPHFIRCIKSNTKKIPGVFEKDLVLQQLQCCGILEVVRISRAGYPTRITHQDFTGRYGFLLSENNVSRDLLSASVAILQKFNIHPEMYQVGYTKLYLRARQYDALIKSKEEVERKKLDEELVAAVHIQSAMRAFLSRRHFISLQNLKKSILKEQNASRKISGVKEVPPSILEELEKRVIKAETTIGEKEKENAALKQQVKEFEMRLSEYEAKIH